MTPEEIKRMQADMDAGTPGPWKYTPWHIEEDSACVRASDGWLMCSTSSDVNARRISRVPQLEAEILRLRDALSGIEVYGTDTLSGPTDGPANREWVSEGVAVMRNRAREALKGDPQ